MTEIMKDKGLYGVYKKRFAEAFPRFTEDTEYN